MSLKKTQAWKWFSKYIKLRDNYICQTCGRSYTGKMMHAGHFIQAFGHNSVFLTRANVYAQCYACNIWGNGKQEILREVVIKRFGKKVEEELWKKAREIKKFDKKELKEIAEIYKNKVKELENKKVGKKELN